jgi:hypothetical protein
LELSFGGDSVLGEDVEDQLRPIDHTGLERILELALLHRRQFVVDEQGIRARARERFLELDQLPFADVRAGLGSGRPLHELSDGLDPGGSCKLLQLAELARRVDSLCQHGNDEPALGLGTRRRIRLA